MGRIKTIPPGLSLCANLQRVPWIGWFFMTLYLSTFKRSWVGHFWGLFLKFSKRNPKNGLPRTFQMLKETKSWKISQFRAFHFISLKESMNYTIKILQWIMVLKKLGSHSYGWVSKLVFLRMYVIIKTDLNFLGFLSNQLFL